MKNIFVKKEGCYYYAARNSDSELLLSHLTHGERKFYEGMFKDLQKLAGAHGWVIEIMK